MKMLLHLGRLVAGSSQRRLGFNPRSGHVGMRWTELTWGEFPPSPSVFLEILISPTAPNTHRPIIDAI
jgi:hypothetical protein